MNKPESVGQYGMPMLVEALTDHIASQCALSEADRLPTLIISSRLETLLPQLRAALVARLGKLPGAPDDLHEWFTEFDDHHEITTWYESMRKDRPYHEAKVLATVRIFVDLR